MIQKNVASQRIKFIMVDATDFATPEPGLSPVGHISKDGDSLVSAANSISEIDSALYVLTLTNSETNCQALGVKATSAGAADQWLVFYPETVKSAVSNVLSTLDDNVASELTAIKSDITAVYSALSDCEATLISDVTAVKSALSDFEASIIVDVSLLQSAFDSLVYGPIGSIMVDWSALVSNVSNVESILINSTFGLDALESLSSQILADTGTTIPATISVLHESVISDIAGIEGVSDSGAISALHASIVTDVAGAVSDITAVYSALSDFEAAITADISQLHESVISDLATVTGDSGAISALHASIVTDVAGAVSDITAVYSALSDLEKEIVSDVTAVKSSVSDVLAAVTNGTYGLSALENLVDTIESTLDGPVASQLSSIEADTASILEDTKTTLDDKIDSILVDTGTTLDGRIPAALVSGRMSADAVAISGSTDAADFLEASAETIVLGTAQTGTLSTTEMTTDLTISVNDQYNGRVLIFRSDTATAALRGQATEITDTVTTNGKLTFTALTTVPANGDVFVIV